MGCGCAGRGLRRNISRDRRSSHAVVAGCGAAVEGEWGLRGFAGGLSGVGARNAPQR